MSERIDVIDSHTAGEPTRVVIDGGGNALATALNTDQPLSERLATFRDSLDHYRRAIACEPRGHDVLVGAVLCPPYDPDCSVGVIFFNNVGFLGMCGHGMIGVVRTLIHLGRLGIGHTRIDTPVGTVGVSVNEDGSISIENVSSYRMHQDVSVNVPGLGTVVGDVAWGGNGFFLVKQPTFEISLPRVRDLQRAAADIRDAVRDAGHTIVDHLELFASNTPADADSQNFVLCPGLEYDRSPCGTGTSAKLACLAADGRLAPGDTWRQAGVHGSKFSAHYRWDDESTGRIFPTITGRAYVTGQAQLIFDPEDPFCWGFGGSQSETQQ
ncbi:proline racemase family protein [Stieleria varia]|uniref:4-hydroxyproline epimerase n=1 Tax=Stieleria varia TaxID=2528005 RepID=A0A5C6B200_9BACT|nr:proline racemase family protein [Stieleria varia]TWU05867.1 4-hydroxyproline epimerase [Stieleria varia]